MTKEQDFFLIALKNFLLSTENTAIGHIDYDQVIAYAKRHQIEGILYHQCKNIKSIQTNEHCKQAYFSAVANYTKRLKLLQNIDKKFSEEQIPFILFKGTEIAAFYSIPSLRTMGDCDILVRKDDKEKARETLLSIGFIDNTTEWKDTEWHFSKNGLDFELHHRLFYDEVANAEKCLNFGDAAWIYAHKASSESSKYILDDNYHFVYLLLHLLKHFINSGVGFRQFMDLSVMIKNCKLNWEWIIKELEKLNLTQFALTCFAFCNKWFGVVAPIENKELDENFYAIASNKIFNNGVFGFDDEDNKNNCTLFQLRQSNVKNKVIITFRYLFPSYRSFIAISKYSFLKGKPMLLPIAWMYRLFYSAFHGTSSVRIKEISDKINISKDQIKSRKEYLERWGI